MNRTKETAKLHQLAEIMIWNDWLVFVFLLFWLCVGYPFMFMGIETFSGEKFVDVESHAHSYILQTAMECVLCNVMSVLIPLCLPDGDSALEERCRLSKPFCVK